MNETVETLMRSAIANEMSDRMGKAQTLIMAACADLDALETLTICGMFYLAGKETLAETMPEEVGMIDSLLRAKVRKEHAENR